MDATHAERAHSRIGPSQAKRVWNCPGSVGLIDSLELGPQVAGRAAAEGTRAHEMVEHALLKRRPIEGTDDMAEAAATFVALVERDAAAASAKHILLVEAPVDLRRHHPELYGTLDAALLDPDRGKLTIYDLKTGRYAVEADDLQLRLYAAMALEQFGDRAKGVLVIDTVIHQPYAKHPDGVTRRARHNRADIIRIASEYVERAHAATDANEPGALVAGAWCKWCAARSQCPAYRDMQTREAGMEFGPGSVMVKGPGSAEAIPLGELGAMLTAAARLKPWIAAVEARALEAMEHGAELPGWTLRDKRAMRQWIDEEQAATRLQAMGVPEGSCFVRVFISPAAAEKLFKPALRSSLANLITANSSGKALAPLPGTLSSADVVTEN
jgi:hypothetical protein